MTDTLTTTGPDAAPVPRSDIIETGGIGVTHAAFAQLGAILDGGADPAQGDMLRVSVLGGGCSGFQYSFGLESTAASDDLVIEKDGLRVVIDAVSQPFLGGAVIDYKDELIGAHFAIDNPNATSSCGCGTSFSI